MNNILIISENYSEYNQEIIKRQILDSDYIKYININESLSYNNFPKNLLSQNTDNIIINLKKKYVGFGKNFFKILYFKNNQSIFFNTNIIFKYPNLPNIIENSYNNNDQFCLSVNYDNYNSILENNKLFHIDNYTQNNIILFNRAIDELYPLKIVPSPKSISTNFIYLVDIFLDKKSGFIDEFFINLFNIHFGNNNGKNVTFTIYNAFSKNLWLNNKINKDSNSTFLDIIINNSINSESKIIFHNYNNLDNDIHLQNLEFRKKSLNNFKNSSADYYYTQDLSHIIDKSNIINDLVIQNKDIIIPLLEQENTLFRNFWTDIDSNGFYKSSNFYYDIINKHKTGIYSIPYFYNTCLISKKFIKKYNIDIFYNNNLWDISDIDMTFCNNLRHFECSMYINCSNVYGKIIKYDKADKYWYKKFTSHDFDTFLIEDSPYHWEKKFIDNNISSNMCNMSNITINEHIKDMYDFMFFSPLLCKCLINIADSLNKWSDGTNKDNRLAGGHENVPTRDIHLNQLDLDDQWKFILNKYISKLASFLYSNFKTNETNIVFLVKYSMDGQKDLCPHHDSSSYSVLFTLNNDFEGGGTYFLRQDYKSQNVPIGNCSIHPGRLTHYHSGIPITSGERYILVGFIN